MLLILPIMLIMNPQQKKHQRDYACQNIYMFLFFYLCYVYLVCRELFLV